VKYLAAFIVTLLGIVLVGYGNVSAVNIFSVCDQAESANSAVCQDKNRTIAISGGDSVLSRVVGILSLVIGFSGVLIMVWGGMNYIMANGDPQKVAWAKDTILFAAIGLVIAIFARLLVEFAIGRIGQ
jgi:hypothetical protein